jgi:orotate phosphoribosyltransferase
MMLSDEGVDEVLGKLRFKRRLSGMDLIIAIAVDWVSGEVLMQAYMNREAVLSTLRTGRVTYWSTSRRELWTKGDSSGSTQTLKGFMVDCDGDAIVLEVEQRGPACHTGLDSCFETYSSQDLEGMKEEVIRAIREKALTFGDFTLTSGRKSSYYLDVKKVTTYPKTLSMISRLIAARMDPDVNLVVGPELGAIPVVVAVALRKGMPYAMIRRGAKEHGTGRRIEGEIGPDNRVLLIDDVTTTGGSLVSSVEAIRSSGAEVAEVVCVADRGEGASEELMASTGLELHPLLTTKDLGIQT